MKKKKVKSEPGEKAVRAVDSSRLTSHVSHSLSHSFIHILCIVFLILVIYSNTLNAPFQWDESEFIVNNPIVKDLHYFTSPSDAKELPLYTALINRYIGYLTFALNYRIHGLSVTGYHIVNIAIHIANSVLVYLFVLLTFRTPFFTSHDSPTVGALEARLTIHDSRSLIAFFSAAIFAVHPLQTEAVTYVFQRFASLVAFFYLLSLVFYIKARLIASSETDSGQAGIVSQFTNSRCFGSTFHGSRFTFFLISFLSAVLAMKTKENAFTLPFVIALYEFCFFNSSSLLPLDKGRMGGVTRRLLYLAPILLTLLIIPLTLMSLTGAHELDPGAYGAWSFARWHYFFTQIRVIITYLRLLFLPVNQNISYNYPVFKSLFDLPVLLSSVFLFLLFGLGVWMIIGNRQWAIGNGTKAKGKEDDSRLFRLIGFGILWFFITLSVESSIIPLSMLINEYRVYLPSIGMIICIVTGVFLVFSRFPIHDSRFTAFKRFTVVTLVLIMGVLSVATYLRNEVWEDSIKLWEDTVKKSPAQARVINNLGNIYQSRNMPDKAMEQYLIAIKLEPDYAEPHNNIGLVYKSLNMPDKAIEQYMLAVKLKPAAAEPHYNLGNIYRDINMPDKAIEQYLIAVKLKPDYAEAHYNLGVIYQSRNIYDKAMEHYLTAIKQKPDYIEAHNNLGVIYQARNIYDKAIEHYLFAINLSPNVAEMHFNLGFVYFQMGQMDKARQELTAGLKIKPGDQKAQDLLKTVTKECKM